METKPEEIIRAFDECREYVFGYSLGRDSPHKDDKKTAVEWIKLGLTPFVAVIVFFEQMNWMHEKFLKYGHAKDKSYIPSSLKVFEDNIHSAIRRITVGGQMDEWEKSESQWRSRFMGWKKDKSFWRHEMWGPEPFETGCRVPRSILKAEPNA